MTRLCLVTKDRGGEASCSKAVCDGKTVSDMKDRRVRGLTERSPF